jgi:hypothetical protein
MIGPSCSSVGLLQGSYRPAGEIVVLRSYVRHRQARGPRRRFSPRARRGSEKFARSAVIRGEPRRNLICHGMRSKFGATAWINRSSRAVLRREEQIAEMLGAERIRRNVAGRVARPWQAGLAPYRRASAYDFFVLAQALESVSSDAGLVARAGKSDIPSRHS